MLTGFALGVVATALVGVAIVGNWIGWERISTPLSKELRRPFHTR